MNLSHLRKNSIIFCDFFLKNRELRTIAYVAKNRREGPFGRKGLFFIDWGVRSNRSHFYRNGQNSTGKEKILLERKFFCWEKKFLPEMLSLTFFVSYLNIVFMKNK